MNAFEVIYIRTCVKALNTFRVVQVMPWILHCQMCVKQSPFGFLVVLNVQKIVSSLWCMQVIRLRSTVMRGGIWTPQKSKLNFRPNYIDIFVV